MLGVAWRICVAGCLETRDTLTIYSWVFKGFRVKLVDSYIGIGDLPEGCRLISKQCSSVFLPNQLVVAAVPPTLFGFHQRTAEDASLCLCKVEVETKPNMHIT